MIDRHFLDDQKELLGVSQITKLHHLLDQTSERLVADITAAAASGDHKQLARSAHQLGSAASALGLVRLFERCRDIELTAPSMSPDACQDAARELATLREASMSALDELLRPGRATVGQLGRLRPICTTSPVTLTRHLLGLRRPDISRRKLQKQRE
ncbi:HPt (histidine-containing phosphotransfer) domain-containing protein [Bradyrhizobium sp. GM24.11]